MDQKSSEPAATPGKLIIMALAPFGLGYFLSYLFRAINAVVAPDLVSELKLTASDLGFLTAAYLLAFSLCQFPLGILRAIRPADARRLRFCAFWCGARHGAIVARTRIDRPWRRWRIDGGLQGCGAMGAA